MNDALEPVDPAGHPGLCGVMEPVDDELSVTDLPVTGHIPDDLRGVYLRNGPNPKFPRSEAIPTRWTVMG